MATWKQTDIVIDGLSHKAQAPIIISASRSTDIPAFYSEWFFSRLEKGYSAWTNPFNGVKTFISYENTRFIVFWSKNPKPLLSYLHNLEEKGIKCYVQYTLNDYDTERLESVPPLEERIETFKQLAQHPAVGAVVWRFDPLMLTDTVGVDDLIEKIRNIGDKLVGYTEKMVFSYADIALYKKVKNNLDRNGVPYKEWTEEQMEDFAQKLSQMNKERGWNYRLATCGERIDVSKLGVEHNRCIDGDLITRIAWSDKLLMDFLKVKIEDPSLIMPEDAITLPGNRYFLSTHKKDPGQRELCGCMAAKDIGEYNTCPHLCEYCYANASKQLALDNYKQHKKNPFFDTITGR